MHRSKWISSNKQYKWPYILLMAVVMLGTLVLCIPVGTELAVFLLDAYGLNNSDPMISQEHWEKVAVFFLLGLMIAVITGYVAVVLLVAAIPVLVGKKGFSRELLGAFFLGEVPGHWIKGGL